MIDSDKPAFWNIKTDLKPGEFESDMIKMLYSTGIDLQKENGVLKDRIKRLEEAGDEILRDNQDMANVNRWWKAKEAKP